MTLLSRVTRTVESHQVIWFASSCECRVTRNFTFFLQHFNAIKWHPTCHKMAPDKLENGAHCCFNKFGCRLFISKFSQCAFYSSLSRDDRIVDFSFPILFCFWKMISVSDANPVLVEIIPSVSETYPKVYCVAQQIFLCCVYFAS